MRIIKIIKVVSLFIVLLTSSQVVAADYAGREDVESFIDELVERHDFDREVLKAWFSGAERLDSVLESIARPAEKVLTWKEYRPIFIKQKRIDLGVEFMKQHADVLARAERETGVPAAVIAAIIGVETYYGRYSGKTGVFDSLVTLGFDYPPRSRFFRSELEQFLLLAREEKLDVHAIRGSYAGAMGMPQFISSSYRAYAVDFDGDGKRDLWNSIPDVIGSVANYFRKHGWQRGEPVVLPARVSGVVDDPTRSKRKPHTRIDEFRRQGITTGTPLRDDELATLVTLQGNEGTEHWLGLQNFYVITRYNHSSMYALAVYQLSQALAEAAG